MSSHQESRERFEKVVKRVHAYHHGSQADHTREILAAHDLATASIITHAMQQIEAGKRKEIHDIDWHRNNAKNECLTILQSLLPEQNIKK